MTMHVHAGNCLEILVDELGRNSAPGPWARPWFPKSSWFRAGACSAGFPWSWPNETASAPTSRFFPNAFLDSLYHSMLPDLFETPALDCRAMLLSHHADPVRGAGPGSVPDIDHYLKDDESGIKFFQLSERIADPF